MDNLTDRLLSEDFEEALNDALTASAYLTTDDYQRWLEEDLPLMAAAIRELHARLATAKKYAAAPVDKGIPMHVYRAVCEQRDYELGERQRMTHRYEVEALRNKELEEQLATAKTEGEAEALEKICMDKSCGGQAYNTKIYCEDGSYTYALGVVEASAIFAEAAAIRKGLEAKEGK